MPQNQFLYVHMQVDIISVQKIREKIRNHGVCDSGWRDKHFLPVLTDLALWFKQEITTNSTLRHKSMNHNKCIYDYSPIHLWVVRSCFSPSPILILLIQDLKNTRGSTFKCGLEVDVSTELVALLSCLGQQFKSSLLLILSAIHLHVRVWNIIKTHDSYLLFVQWYYQPWSCYEKELQKEDRLKMLLKGSPHFQLVLAWNMLSLTGERRSNDITYI